MDNEVNQLSGAEAERLVKLIEECGEVIQAATKVLRHGYESSNPHVLDGDTNKALLEKEMGDLSALFTLMVEQADVNAFAIGAAQAAKRATQRQYIHFQEED